jgi:hypothetical protein
MNWWSLAILGKVDRTLITYLPDPESGIVSKLEIVELPDMFRRLQNSRVIFICLFNFVNLVLTLSIIGAPWQ